MGKNPISHYLTIKVLKEENPHSGYATHVEEGEKEKFCMCDRFSADGFRTRAVRVIRWRVLGFGLPKGKTGKERMGRPGGSWALGKRCLCVGVRFVSAGRGPEGRFKQY